LNEPLACEKKSAPGSAGAIRIDRLPALSRPIGVLPAAFFRRRAWRCVRGAAGESRGRGFFAKAMMQGGKKSAMLSNCVLEWSSRVLDRARRGTESHDMISPSLQSVIRRSSTTRSHLGQANPRTDERSGAANRVAKLFGPSRKLEQRSHLKVNGRSGVIVVNIIERPVGPSPLTSQKHCDTDGCTFGNSTIWPKCSLPLPPPAEKGQTQKTAMSFTFGLSAWCERKVAQQNGITLAVASDGDGCGARAKLWVPLMMVLRGGVNPKFVVSSVRPPKTSRSRRAYDGNDALETLVEKHQRTAIRNERFVEPTFWPVRLACLR